MTTYYHRYYNAPKRRGEQAGQRVTVALKDKALSISGKQYGLFKDLVDFLEQRGVHTEWLGKPRDAQHCTQKINALYTMLKKHGLYEEWRAQNEGGDDE